MQTLQPLTLNIERISILVTIGTKQQIKKDSGILILLKKDGVSKTDIKMLFNIPSDMDCHIQNLIGR